MSDFFHGWRRKAGCVTLVISSVAMAAWIRSRAIEDAFEFSLSRRPQVIVSSHGKIEWLWFDDYAISSFSPAPAIPAFPLSSRTLSPISNFYFDDPESRWQLEWYGFYSSDSSLVLRRFCVPYQFVTIPLTLLSAYLLLWPGKRPERKSKAPVEGK